AVKGRDGRQGGFGLRQGVSQRAHGVFVWSAAVLCSAALAFPFFRLYLLCGPGGPGPADLLYQRAGALPVTRLDPRCNDPAPAVYVFTRPTARRPIKPTGRRARNNPAGFLNPSCRRGRSLPIDGVANGCYPRTLPCPGREGRRRTPGRGKDMVRTPRSRWRWLLSASALWTAALSAGCTATEPGVAR